VSRNNELSRYGPNPEYSDDEDVDRIGAQHKKVLITFDKAWNTLTSLEDVSSFMESNSGFAECLDKQDSDEGRSLLHTIARPQTFEKRKLLFKWLMKTFPELYLLEDHNAGRTVLSGAIRQKQENRKRPQFVKFFVQEFPEEAAKLVREEKTLIHDLLPLAGSCARALLPHLSPETMMEKDSKGNTILHLASRYNHIYNEESDRTEEQLQFIEELIKRCPESLKATNKAGESAYQHRVTTYRLSNPNIEESDFRRPLHADRITNLLKDHYMHMEHRDDTIRLLHGSVQGKLKEFGSA
jgi:hypothetical protein